MDFKTSTIVVQHYIITYINFHRLHYLTIILFSVILLTTERPLMHFLYVVHGPTITQTY